MVRPLVLCSLSIGLAASAVALGSDVAGGAQDSASSPPAPVAPSGNLIQMNRIELLTDSPMAGEILTAPHGFDMDHDGQREFVFRAGTHLPGENTPLEFYESIADDTFVLDHVLDLENSPNDVYVATDVGDIDGDGLSDLVVFARDWISNGVVDYGTQVYESISPGAYPAVLVWEEVNNPSGPSLGDLVADTDIDGKQEIIVIEPAQGAKLVIYENDGDNSYAQIYSLEPLPLAGSVQSLSVTDDLDGDGRDEILIGGITSPSILATESTGDNTFVQTWSLDFDPHPNVKFLIEGGDLDGDGKKELLAGGSLPSTSQSVIHIVESPGNDQVEVVHTFTLPASDDFYTSANVADVDGDGRREIVIATGSLVKIYENTGDNAWQEIWSGTGGSIQAIGAGDHDQDGKDEIIFRLGSVTNGSTAIFEIDDAFAADMDGDDTVDVIDNCPAQFNPGQEDADFDGVGDVCDNCIHGPNPAQGLAPFGQGMLATDSQTFSWPQAADIVYVRGDLFGVSSYATEMVDTLSLATSLTDNTPLVSGDGLYYLVRPDCLVGSWQTTIGAEPARDGALP